MIGSCQRCGWRSVLRVSWRRPRFVCPECSDDGATLQPAWLLRIGLALLLSLVFLVALAILVSARPAGASPPLPCSETSAQLPLGLTHGNPQTGLEPAPGFYDYNYLFVSPTQQCPVAPTRVHLHATLSVAEIVPAIGQPGRVPTQADAETIWLTFHSGTGASGFAITKDVAETGDSVAHCNVPGKGTETCVTLHGTDQATLDYVGPDVFKGSYGDKQTIVGPNILTLDESLVIEP